MPRPATIADLFDLVRRSRLVDESRLASFISTIASTATAPSTPDGILHRMIEDGLLTQFQADHLAVGRWKGLVLGNYRILEKIGTGGMGVVYRGEHTTLLTPVAIKVLTARLATDAIARERILREARAAAALSHPNIVRVIDVDPDAASPFLVMEYIDGVSLQAAVARFGTFDGGTAAFIGRQVLLALQRACDVGLVHRDIKPANVLVDRTGLVKVLDLGIVRVAGGSELTIRRSSRHILGTADYLAPEQAINSHTVDSRADIYALGGTLYFMLAGHPPYPDGGPQEKVRNKQEFDPPPIHHLRPDISPQLSAIIQKMLVRDPRQRYRTPIMAAEAMSPFAFPESRFPAFLFSNARATVSDVSIGLTCPGDSGPALPSLPPRVPPPSPPTDVIVITDSHTILPRDDFPTNRIPQEPAMLEAAPRARRWRSWLMLALALAFLAAAVGTLLAWLPPAAGR